MYDINKYEEDKEDDIIGMFDGLTYSYSNIIKTDKNKKYYDYLKQNNYINSDKLITNIDLIKQIDDIFNLLAN